MPHELLNLDIGDLYLAAACAQAGHDEEIRMIEAAKRRGNAPGR